MNKKEKLGVLSILIIVIIILMARQSVLMHKEIKKINRPTIENRQFGNMSVYKWVTVRDLARRHNLKEENIFKALEIKPENGDENIPIGELARKYNKTPQEIESDLKKIIKKHKNIEGIRYE